MACTHLIESAELINGVKILSLKQSIVRIVDSVILDVMNVVFDSVINPNNLDRI